MVRATGGQPLEQILQGGPPQIVCGSRSALSVRIERPLRPVLGIIGATGIGAILREVMRGFDYVETAATLLIIIVGVILNDRISARIRR